MGSNTKDGFKKITKGTRKTSKPINETDQRISEGSGKPFDIPGVAKLVLSDITQKIVSCVVGEDVTAEDPWTYVQREILEDNIDLHEDSSEFLPIAMQIKKYPEKEILVGWIPAGSKKNDYFYVVYDKEAKSEVLQTIEKQKIEMDNRLQKAILRPAGSWKSQGSEKEVDLSISQSFRPLYEIKIESTFPIPNGTVHFHMRNVEDARDGYIELLPDPRYPIINVEKKRIDASVQAALQKVNSAAQTDPPYPKNAITEYEYLRDLEEFKEKGKLKIINQPDVKLAPTIITFIPEMIDQLTGTLYFNGNVNLYEDDYKLLQSATGKRSEYESLTDLRYFLSLSEVKTTKKNVACDASWYSFKSGILAVCYANNCFSELAYGLDTSDEVNLAVEGACPVLLWSYDDGLKPKLYLQTPTEVTFVSFCPHKENILVGGCKNGRIIIWDLTNKLEEVETYEILTYNQQKNRGKLLSSMNWMKNTHNIADVQPVLISALTDSHTMMVTSIKWIHPSMELTKNGKWITNKETEHKSLSFFTFAIDGSILVWDLTVIPSKDVLQKSKRKLKRLERIPSALTAADSNLKNLQKVFKPYFKIIVKDESNTVPILAVVRKPNILNYAPLNKINWHAKVRTEYILSKEQSEVEKYPLFVTTADGRLLQLTWEGYDFASGQELNTEEATLRAFHAIHDGPIVACRIHPLYDEFLMTVGGRILAIWNTDLPRAIMWRKASGGYKYMSASWTYEHSSYCCALRSDGVYEIWDFNYSSKHPMRIVNMGGELKTSVMGTLHGKHARKGTIGVTDNIGSVTVYHFPALMNKSTKERIEQTRHLLYNFTNRLKYIMQWIEKYEEKNNQAKEEEARHLIESVKRNKIENDTLQKNMSEVEKMEKIFCDVDWDKHAVEKCEILLNRKKINLSELQKQRHALLQVEMEKRGRLIKLGEVLKQKDKILGSAVETIINGERTERERKYTIQEQRDYNMIEHFEEIEERTLWMIYTNPYEPELNFNRYIEERRAQKEYVNKCLKWTNIRTTSQDSKLYISMMPHRRRMIQKSKYSKDSSTSLSDD